MICGIRKSFNTNFERFIHRSGFFPLVSGIAIAVCAVLIVAPFGSTRSSLNDILASPASDSNLLVQDANDKSDKKDEVQKFHELWSKKEKANLVNDPRAIVQLQAQGLDPDGIKSSDKFNFQYELTIETTDFDVLDSTIKAAEEITGNEVRYKYDELVSGFSIFANIDQMQSIARLDNIVSVNFSNMYAPTDDSANTIVGAGDIHTNTDYNEGAGLKGEGTLVAVIDSGLDCTHKDLNLSESGRSKMKLTRPEVEDKVATEIHHGRWCTEKVPYVFNSGEFLDIDKSPDDGGTVNDIDAIIDHGEHQHGMHTTGIVAANAQGGDSEDGVGDEYGVSGAAPEAQIAFFRVANRAGLIYEAALINSVIDAVKLGVDVISISIGASATVQSDDDFTQKIYNAASEKGIPCVVSAGNEGAKNQRVSGETLTSNKAYENSTVISGSIAKEAFSIGSTVNPNFRTRSASFFTNEDTTSYFQNTEPNNTTKLSLTQGILTDSTSSATAVTTNESIDGNTPWPVPCLGHTMEANYMGYDDALVDGDNCSTVSGDTYNDDKPQARLVVLPNMTADFTQNSEDSILSAVGSGTKEDVEMLDPYDSNSSLYCKKAIIVVARSRATPSQTKAKNIVERCGQVAGMIVIDFSDQHVTNIRKAELTTIREVKVDKTVGKDIVNYWNTLQTESKYLTAGFGVKLDYAYVTNNTAINKMSDFSSWGPTADLEFKPDFSAPGENIMSIQNNNGYALMSGTSMACPLVAGATALLVQKLELQNSERGNVDFVRKVKALLSNTTSKVDDEYPDNGVPESPRVQGSGQIDIAKAIASNVLVQNTANGSPNFALKTIGKQATFTAKITNMSDVDRTYQIPQDSDVYEEIYEETPIPITQVYNADNAMKLPEHPDYQNRMKMLDQVSNGSSLRSNANELTLNAGESKNIVFTLNVGESAAENTFIEGWLTLIETSPSVDADKRIDLVAPYIGFFGTNASEPLIDAPQYCSTDNTNFNTYVEQNYCPKGLQTTYGYGSVTSFTGATAGQQVYIGQETSNPISFTHNFEDADGNSIPKTVPVVYIDPEKIATKSNCSNDIITYQPCSFGLSLYANRFIKDIYVSLLDSEKNEITHKIGEDKNEVSGTFGVYAKFPSILPDGQYYLRITSSGLWGETDDQSFVMPLKVDNTPPKIDSFKIELKQDEYVEGQDIAATGYMNYSNHYYPVAKVKLSDNVGFDWTGLLSLLGSEWDSAPTLYLETYNTKIYGYDEPQRFMRMYMPLYYKADGTLATQDTSENEFEFRIDPVQAAYLENGVNEVNLSLVDSAGNETELSNDSPLRQQTISYPDATKPGGTANGSIALYGFPQVFNANICRSELANDGLDRSNPEYFVNINHDWNNLDIDSEAFLRHAWYTYCPSTNSFATSPRPTYYMDTSSQSNCNITFQTGNSSLIDEDESTCTYTLKGSYYKDFYYNISHRLNKVDDSPDTCLTQTDRFGNSTYGSGANWANINCFASDTGTLVTPDANGNFTIEFTETVAALNNNNGYSASLSFSPYEDGEPTGPGWTCSAIACSGDANLIDDSRIMNDMDITFSEYGTPSEYTLNTASGGADVYNDANLPANYPDDSMYPFLGDSTEKVGYKGYPVFHPLNLQEYGNYKNTQGQGRNYFTGEGAISTSNQGSSIYYGQPKVPVIYNYGDDKIDLNFKVGRNLRAFFNLNIELNSENQNIFHALAIGNWDDKIFQDGDSFPNSGNNTGYNRGYDAFFPCYVHNKFGAVNGVNEGNTSQSYIDKKTNDCRDNRYYYDLDDVNDYYSYDDLERLFDGDITSESGEYESQSQTIDTGDVQVDKSQINYILSFLISYSGKVYGNNDAYNVKPFLTIVDNVSTRSPKPHETFSTPPISLWNMSLYTYDGAYGGELPYKADPDNPNDLGYNVARDYDFDKREYTLRGQVLTKCYDISTLRISVPPHSDYMPITDYDADTGQFSYTIAGIEPVGYNQHIRLNVNTKSEACNGYPASYPVETELMINAIGPKLVIDQGDHVSTEYKENLVSRNGRYYPQENKELWTNEKLDNISGTIDNNGSSWYIVSVNGNIAYSDFALYNMMDEDLYQMHNTSLHAWSDKTHINYPEDGIRNTSDYQIDMYEPRSYSILGNTSANLQLHYLKRQLEAPNVEANGNSTQVQTTLSDSEQQISAEHPEEQIHLQYRNVNPLLRALNSQSVNGLDISAQRVIKAQVVSDGWNDVSANSYSLVSGTYEFRAIDRYGNTSESVTRAVIVNGDNIANTGSDPYTMLYLLALLIAVAFSVRTLLQARVKRKHY